MGTRTDEKWTADPVTVGAGATSAPVLIPGHVFDASAAINLQGAGAGKVQHSLSPEDNIKANPNGSNVFWHDWTPGVVTSSTSASITGPITAVRAVNSGGNPLVLEVVAQRSRFNG